MERNQGDTDAPGVVTQFPARLLLLRMFSLVLYVVMADHMCAAPVQ